MRPEVDQTLQLLAETVLGEIAPKLPDDYARRNAQIVGMLMAAALEQWDRAAEIRLEENRSIRALFRRAIPVVSDDALRTRLEDLASRRRSSVRIGALNADNDALRSLLIELQEHLEGLDTTAARRIEAATWKELLASTERRKLSISPF